MNRSIAYTFRKLQPLLFTGVLAGTLGLASNAAAAKTVVALDADFAVPISFQDTNSGGGGALRFGRQFGLVLVSLTPEVGGGYYKFAGDPDAAIYRVFAGGRVAFGKIVEPSAYAHIGYGKLHGTSDDHFAPVMDAGLALDVTVIPVINFGVHGAYNAVLPSSDDSSFRWVSVGLHAALVF
jgi:hypothetical protein